jgi:hypothetical protein
MNLWTLYRLYWSIFPHDFFLMHFLAIFRLFTIIFEVFSCFLSINVRFCCSLVLVAFRSPHPRIAEPLVRVFDQKHPFSTFLHIFQASTPIPEPLDAFTTPIARRRTIIHVLEPYYASPTVNNHPQPLLAVLG